MFLQTSLYFISFWRSGGDDRVVQNVGVGKILVLVEKILSKWIRLEILRCYKDLLRRTNQVGSLQEDLGVSYGVSLGLRLYKEIVVCNVVSSFLRHGHPKCIYPYSVQRPRWIHLDYWFQLCLTSWIVIYGYTSLLCYLVLGVELTTSEVFWIVLYFWRSPSSFLFVV